MVKKDSPTSRFLVTGGAGFIGNRVVSNLLTHPSELNVAILDNLSAGLPMPNSGPRLKVYEADIRDRLKLDEVLENFQPDTIVHLAAVHHIPTCEKHRSYALDVNVVGTEALLEVAEARGLRRFILASSGAVYDWCEGPLSENLSVLKPHDNYSLAKYTNEMQLSYWTDRTGGLTRVARIFNTIGHDDPNAHLIPDIISQISLVSKSANIELGNITPRRDYIHVDDTSRAITALALDDGPPGMEVFNVSTGKDVSVAELVALLGDVIGIKINIREDETRKRRVDRPSQLGSNIKIKERLGFTPKKSLRIALEDIVRNLTHRPSEKS